MQITIKRMMNFLEEGPGEVPSGKTLKRLAVAALIDNPYAGKYVEDLSTMVAASVAVGEKMAEAARKIYGDEPVECYGKAGLVGLAGEQEHSNALLTTAFAEPFRATFGGKAWISSVTKIAIPGELLDVPMNSTANVYVRSHYSAMSLAIPGAPLPHEIVLIFCLANRGRINARVGGMSQEEALRA